MKVIATEMAERIRWYQESGMDIFCVAQGIHIGTPLQILTLSELREEIGDCRRCKLCEERTQIVFGSGDTHASLMFVGEAPGEEEDVQGVPFVGRAGQLLTKMIQAMGLTREAVYIANIVKCRPPNNRNPEPDEIAACSPFLRKQIQAIRPKVICCLGAFAAHTLLATTERISDLRGKFFDYEGSKLIPTFHPAYLLRNPSAKKVVWEDLQQIMTALNSDYNPILSQTLKGNIA